jgi:tetratricopeptide (TPR) repeat protein
MYRTLVGLSILLLAAPFAHAGLYYSGEKYASLPTQWRGFLLDHRTLRNIAVKPKTEAEASPLRQRYLQEAKALQARLDKDKLDADGIADLGALYIRLGEAERAVEILRPAQRAHANHFAIAANLGTAWQVLGDYRQAAASLEEAVRLAPGKHQAFEDAHLKLVRARQREKAGELDDLFGVRYVNDTGTYEPGKFAAAQKKKLPTKAVEITQQLALWLPADGPLLWQLAELANAHGDFPNGAAMLEGCVAQFGMSSPTLKAHRQILREAVDNLPKAKLGAEHEEKHTGTIAFRSRRPLISQSLTGALPPIDPKGINPVPWELFSETAIEKPFKVSFPKYLQELQGKQVALTGFMYPLREDPDMAAFLFIEAPVGCWYCEMPETTGIIYVELPPGQTARYQRGLIRIVGRLALNGSDPEDFLYAVRDARVGALD